MPWDDDIVLTQNGSSRRNDDTSTFGSGATVSGGFVQYGYTSGNSAACSGIACSGNAHRFVWTNYYTSSRTLFSTANTSAGGVYSGGGVLAFDPVQVAGLRGDYKAYKEDRARKRAELKARRLFKRVVGDVAYQNFKKRGYHEIYGVSRTRYRLTPGRWVEVMKGPPSEASDVEYELCAHLEFGIPWFDTVAMQHLMLTSSAETEKQFCSIANKHQVGVYPIDEMRRTA